MPRSRHGCHIDSYRRYRKGAFFFLLPGVLDSNVDVGAFVDGIHSREEEWGRVGLILNASQSAPDTTLRAEANFNNDEVSLDPLAGVFVSFLDVRIDSAAFSEIHFRIENSRDVLFDQLFSDVDEALVFFNTVLDLGELADGFVTQTINLQFTLEALNPTQGTRFGTAFAVGTAIVPEPGTGLLLITGLILLSSRKSGRNDRDSL
jgi:hypothetical protein